MIRICGSRKSEKVKKKVIKSSRFLIVSSLTTSGICLNDKKSRKSFLRVGTKVKRLKCLELYIYLQGDKIIHQEEHDYASYCSFSRLTYLHMHIIKD